MPKSSFEVEVAGVNIRVKQVACVNLRVFLVWGSDVNGRAGERHTAGCLGNLAQETKRSSPRSRCCLGHQQYLLNAQIWLR